MYNGGENWQSFLDCIRSLTIKYDSSWVGTTTINGGVPMTDIVKTTRRVKASDDSYVNVTVQIDFSSATREQIIEWATSNRVIAGQRVWRELDPSEIKTSVDGQTFDAVNIGRKIRSREDQIKQTMNPALGIDRDMAEWIVDNPDEYRKMLEQMKKSNQ